MQQFAHDGFRIDADHWPSLRARVDAETAGGYARFRKDLAPRHGVVWRDIALGYAALALIVVAVGSVEGLVSGLLAAIFGAVAIGVAIAYLQLFIHEAAHYNLARDRATNDRIADTLIAWQVGTTIAAYRRVHFDHHRHFGHAEDGERSWAHRLSWRLVAGMLTGIHALRIFLARRGDSTATPSSKLPLIRGGAIHALLLGAMLALGAWPAALAWIGGVGIMFPFFATLRPLLEHRRAASDDALLGGDRDAVTRLFTDGPFARIFGGAGFTRHMLHHWEPQVSYTRLAELEAYLARTSIGPILDARRTTYWRAFRDILASDNVR